MSHTGKDGVEGLLGQTVSDPSSLRSRSTSDAQPSADRRAVIARTICKSGRFETGHGTCAAICLSMFGDARRRCDYATRVHGALAQQIDEALTHSQAEGR